jgi:hypothetical protein
LVDNHFHGDGYPLCLRLAAAVSCVYTVKAVYAGIRVVRQHRVHALARPAVAALRYSLAIQVGRNALRAHLGTVEAEVQVENLPNDGRFRLIDG